VITGFRLLEPGLTEITVHQDAIRLGSLFGADPARMQPLAEALTRGGVPAVVSPNISSDLLAKLLYNCALNPLGALLGVRYGALADDPESREIMNAVVAEIFAVLGAAGLTTSWPDAPAYLADFYARLIPPTASHESSMLQDLRGGRRTEIDFLSGAVARLGRTWGVATPVNTALLALVRAAEQRGRA
jgi:2-dehydropantoate 2-reductase